MAILTLLVAIVLAGCASDTEPEIPEISADRIATHVRFLSHDLLEGRGVGSRGEALATEYLATQLALAGARPAGDDGGYFQKVPLVGVETLADSRVSLGTRSLESRSDYVGHNQRQTDRTSLNSEIVFVGHGIVAPEFGWDDYKGADVRGKLVLLFTNEPPSEDVSFFGGAALTYYGRWTFKYEEALRQGAAAVLIVHTDQTAGYSWDVVRNSWGQRSPSVRLEPGQDALALAGWIHSDAAAEIFAASAATTEHSIDELVELANSKEFVTIPLGLTAAIDIRSSVSPMDTRNVVAMFEGSHPELKNEAVVYTAHWDHFGMSAQGDGDRIYNGAVDNATGCGTLLELAAAFGSLSTRPSRSIIFAAVGAEESGLLGSDYYAGHPVIAVGKTAANLNYDGLYPFGATRDISMPGYERTTLQGVVEALADEFGLSLTPDAHPEQGYYYRSDHFSLAKRGVPAISIGVGQHYLDRPEGWGEERVAEYRDKHYHQPSDEFQPSWDFTGIATLARFGFDLGMIVAEQPELPSWKPGDEFLAAREASE